MSTFAKLKANFDTNWTTILVGWNGLGAFSPWPDRADEFPPLLSVDELTAYANERLASSSDVAEEDLIVKLLSLNLHTESRKKIRDILTQLSDLSGGDQAFEIRKWRLILLEELLENIPKDAPLWVNGFDRILAKFRLSIGQPARSSRPWKCNSSR